MDILEFYVGSRTDFSFSSFAEEHKFDIINHSCELSLEDFDWKALKSCWSNLLREFCQKNNDIKVKADLFKVDWEDYMLLREAAIQNKQLKRSISEIQAKHSSSLIQLNQPCSQQLENPFLYVSEPNLENIIYKEAIKQQKANMKYIPKLNEQDMLFYGILDFTKRKENSSTMKCFSQADFSTFKKKNTELLNKNTTAGNYCKDIFTLSGDTSVPVLKETIKKEKTRLQALKATPLTELFVLKACKHLLNSRPLDYANEDAYLYFVLAPMLKCLIKINDRVELLFGETNLKAKAIEVNKHLYDDERRFAGPKIDIVFIDKKYDLEVVVVEVSGPPYKTDQTHFLEDRNKICKNLKSMFKRFVSKMEVPTVALIKKLKLFGIQFYNNTVFVYSFGKPCSHCYAFSLVASFPVPDNTSLMPQSLPTFIRNIYMIDDAVEKTRAALDNLFFVDPNQEVLSDDNDDESPHTSPRKKLKQKATTSNDEE